MPHIEIAECPRCGKVASGRKEIEKLFGYRYDGTMPQSYCRECRNEERTEKHGCGFTSCEWSDEYPRCKNSPKCPFEN